MVRNRRSCQIFPRSEVSELVPDFFGRNTIRNSPSTGHRKSLCRSSTHSNCRTVEVEYVAHPTQGLINGVVYPLSLSRMSRWFTEVQWIARSWLTEYFILCDVYIACFQGGGMGRPLSVKQPYQSVQRIINGSSASAGRPVNNKTSMELPGLTQVC